LHLTIIKNWGNISSQLTVGNGCLDGRDVWGITAVISSNWKSLVLVGNG